MRQALSRVILAACAAMLASCGGSGGGDASGGTPASPRTLALVAGTLDAGGSGSADGTGAEARFSAADLAMGSDGNLYVADNSTIRRVTPTGSRRRTLRLTREPPGCRSRGALPFSGSA